MKRSALFGIFALLLGVFLGSLFPPGLFPWSSKAPRTDPVTAPDPTSQAAISNIDGLNAPQPSPNNAGGTLDPQDNAALLQAACQVIGALHDQDYAALSRLVHSELGVTFTPYSTVDLEIDLTFYARQIAGLAEDDKVYTWGKEDGRGDLIELTMTDYLRAYVFDVDYSRATQVAIDQVQQLGNALENVAEIYPNARFVEFHIPDPGGESGGLDWHSLKTVFLPEGDHWRLIALIHSQWTV